VLVPDGPVPEVPVPDGALLLLLLLLLPGRVVELLLLPGVVVLLRDVPAPLPRLESLPVPEPLRPVMPLGSGTVRPSSVIICPAGSVVVSTRVARPLWIM
jgi:hypothetical protein